MKYSLVIPVYRNEASLPELVECINELSQSLDDTLETVFVIDGSPDRSAEVLHGALAEVAWPWQLIQLSRNYGSFQAIQVGLGKGRGEFFAVMAADLQEPPSLVENFFTLLSNDEADIALGSRSTRADPLSTQWASRIFWWLYRKLVNASIPPGGVDMFACNRKVRDQLVGFNEANTSLIQLLFWVGFRRVTVPYDRAERKHGKSAWSFRRKARYLADSVFGFTDLPIRILLVVGSCGLIISGVVGVVVLAGRLLGLIPVVGYTPIMLTFIFFSALQIFSLGILGSYLWRTFENTKSRPQAIIMNEELSREKPA